MILLFRIIVFGGFLYLALVLILVDQQWVISTMTRERQAQVEFMGQDRALTVQINAENAFTKALVNTGIMNNSMSALEPKNSNASQPNSGPSMLDKTVLFIKSRLQAFWTMVFQVFLRIYYMVIWWPIVIMVLIPTVVDAIARRRAAQYTFASTSPHLQGLALRAIPTILLIYSILLFAPFYIPPAITPFIVLLTIGLTWFTLAHFAKRW